MTVQHASTLDRDWAGPIRVLAAQSRRMTEAQAEALLHERYGIVAKATPLSSERDQNFAMASSDGARVVLKLCNGLQDQGLSRFQTRALKHVAQVAPDLSVPRVVPTTDGGDQFRWDDGKNAERVGYVASYVEGAPVAGQVRTVPLAARMGALSARLGRALRGLFDPAAGHELLWDLKHAARLIELLPFIRGDRDRSLASTAIDRFRAGAESRLPALRGQIIHGDLNPSNILVDPTRPEVSVGVIDFGDMVHGALINDVAVAAAYMVAEADDPFVLIAAFVAAYHEVTALEEEEIDLLPDLIATRHAMTCAIANWRAERYPDNAPYILRNAEVAVRGLEVLAGPARVALARRLVAACRGRGAS